MVGGSGGLTAIYHWSPPGAGIFGRTVGGNPPAASAFRPFEGVFPAGLLRYRSVGARHSVRGRFRLLG